MTSPRPRISWSPTRDRLVAVASEAFREAVAELDLLRPGALERIFDSGEAQPGGGRGGNRVLALPGRPERLHLRPCRHGGWLARALGPHFTGPSRALAELDANTRLYRRGAAVARPVLVAAARCAPGRWIAAVGTLNVEAACNLQEWLAAAPASEAVLREAQAVGRRLRGFHDRGGSHADLHLGNLLIREAAGATSVTLIDLDRARVLPEVSARRRMREIMRLHRSLVKHRLLAGLPREAFEAFLVGYTRGDPRLRAALLGHLPRERRRLAFHRIAYR